MSVFAGKNTYKGYEIFFWLTPKTIKATIWKPHDSRPVKRFWVRDKEGAYTRLKSRIMAFLDRRMEL